MGGNNTRAVAGTIDTVMDLTLSSSLPCRNLLTGGMKKWSLKTETDPLKKAERDAAAVIMPMLLTGGVIGGLQSSWSHW